MRPVKGLLSWLLASVVLPAAVGVTAGAAISAASWLFETRLLLSLTSLPGLWPALFVLLVIPLSHVCFRRLATAFSPGTNELYIIGYHDPDQTLPVKQVPGRFAAGAVTAGFGGSQGMESASAFLGAGLGSLARTRLRIDWERYGKDVVMISGASAGIAAIFSSPLVGAAYGIEVPFRRGIDMRHVVPAVVGALCAYSMRLLIGGPNPIIPEVGDFSPDALLLLAVVLTAVACGLGARAFATIQAWLHQRTGGVPAMRRSVAISLALCGLALAGFLVAGQWVTYGAGYIASGWAFDSSQTAAAVLVVLLLHTSGTLLCLYGQAGGGVFTSLALTGALTGQVIATLLGVEAGFVLVAIGAACFLGSGYRLPVAAVLLVVEVSWQPLVIVAGIGAVLLAVSLMGQRTTATAQQPRGPRLLGSEWATTHGQ